MCLSPTPWRNDNGFHLVLVSCGWEITAAESSEGARRQPATPIWIGKNWKQLFIPELGSKMHKAQLAGPRHSSWKGWWFGPEQSQQGDTRRWGRGTDQLVLGAFERQDQQVWVMDFMWNMKNESRIRRNKEPLASNLAGYLGWWLREMKGPSGASSELTPVCSLMPCQVLL